MILGMENGTKLQTRGGVEGPTSGNGHIWRRAMEGTGELGDKWPREPASRDRFGREERFSRGAPCVPKWSPWAIRASEGG